MTIEKSSGGKNMEFPLASEAENAISAITPRADRSARAIKRLMALPDLSRMPGSPVKFVLDAIMAQPRFEGFDRVKIPEVVHVRENFDLLNTPLDHPARQPSDTYYLSGNSADGWVLRTHTTCMWPYYLSAKDVRDKLDREGRVAALCHGRVFRNDEVDRTHYPCFHQLDGLYIVDRRHGRLERSDLVEVLESIARAVFGESIKTKVTDDFFPFTDPSVELAVEVDGRSLEVLGAGCVHPQVLTRFGLDPSHYSGWAFGFGIDRLAMVRMSIPDIRILWSDDPRIRSQFENLESRYTAVSNYPATTRDITFLLGKSMSLNRFYEVVREEGVIGNANAVEQVDLVDRYESDEKFGSENRSYSFRITYRLPERTLTNSEVNAVQERIRAAVVLELGAALR